MVEKYKTFGRLFVASCIVAGCQKTPEPGPVPTATPKITEAPTQSPMPEQEKYWQEFMSAYSDWKNNYIKTTDNLLKVVQPENGGITTSEGIAYGMIMSVNAADRNTFEKLWGFAQKHFNSNGLMSWKIEPDGKVPDKNSATDADLDMTYSLIIADVVWGGYKNQSLEMINKIMIHEVEKNSYVLKPGDSWGGSNITNPSYFSPGYFQLFKQLTNDSKWDLVLQKSKEILDKINKKHCLYPDWSTSEGNPVPGQDYNYSYNAVRVSWRQKIAFEWFGDRHAKVQLKKINNFFQDSPVLEIVDGYGPDCKVVGRNHNAAFVSAFALSSSDKEATRELIRLQNENYFNDSLRALSLLLLSNRMIH